MLQSIESFMLSNHLILCHPLLLLPSIFPNIRVYSNELALCIRWPKFWSFSSCPSKESESAALSLLPTLISFRIDWFDLLAVQGMLGVPWKLSESSLYSAIPKLCSAVPWWGSFYHLFCWLLGGIFIPSVLRHVL